MQILQDQFANLAQPELTSKSVSDGLDPTYIPIRYRRPNTFSKQTITKLTNKKIK